MSQAEDIEDGFLAETFQFQVSGINETKDLLEGSYAGLF
jgi:hypothetical protein